MFSREALESVSWFEGDLFQQYLPAVPAEVPEKAALVNKSGRFALAETAGTLFSVRGSDGRT
jgi:hypothetical protein